MNEELIGQILNDPEKMAQLSALAESLGLNGAPPEAPPPLPKPPAPNRVDKRLEALLCALKAYLPPDGCRRLDRAAELARLMRLMERLNGGEPSAPDPKRSD